ncbi:hypothetical protein CBR_g41586 [Chara braunii]|uniref:Uncharacterized protein n=1 Tax=Chara braunii TaxID=69332 RepID=A0A388LW97_CHABU|nr:hypothetical protein CBR_g41586 [Chara braunii]|eukprot:GBG86523.1 hypothetical protein CBR_g41586 [Chara braunii]
MQSDHVIQSYDAIIRNKTHNDVTPNSHLDAVIWNNRCNLTGTVAQVYVIGQCHWPQNGDGEPLTAHDVHLRNRRDDIHDAGSDNGHEDHDDDYDDEDDDRDDDHDNDDEDDDDNGDMIRWNQKTGYGDIDGDKELLESLELLESPQNGDDYDDDEDDDTGGMNHWNQRTVVKEREDDNAGLGGALYWDKKRCEERRVDFKDSGDMKGSEQEDNDNSVGKNRTWMGRRREW